MQTVLRTRYSRTAHIMDLTLIICNLILAFIHIGSIQDILKQHYQNLGIVHDMV